GAASGCRLTPDVAPLRANRPARARIAAPASPHQTTGEREVGAPDSTATTAVMPGTAAASAVPANNACAIDRGSAPATTTMTAARNPNRTAASKPVRLDPNGSTRRAR